MLLVMCELLEYRGLLRNYHNFLNLQLLYFFKNLTLSSRKAMLYFSNFNALASENPVSELVRDFIKLLVSVENLINADFLCPNISHS